MSSYLLHSLLRICFPCFQSQCYIAPSNNENICIKIEYNKYKNNFEHLLTKKIPVNKTLSPTDWDFLFYTKALPFHFSECQRRMRIMPRRFSSMQNAAHIPIRPKPIGMPSNQATPTATLH